MKFSKQSTYGLRAMICLAKHWKKESLSLTKISQIEDISKKYLEQIFIKLKKSNLIESEKGVKGGYKLKLSPKEITVFDIIISLEKEITPSGCLAGNGAFNCEKSCNCGVISLLSEIQASVLKILKSTSLQDISDKHKF